jgi:hypothetical protein
MFTRGLFRRYPGESDPPQFQVIGALLLIALGVVFLAQRAGILETGGNWWVIFLFFPGLGLLWSALAAHRKLHATNEQQVIEAGIGVVLIILTLIFIFDPNWSFLNETFRASVWDRVWRFVVLGLGIALMAVGFVRHWAGIVVLGALVAVAGVVFIFDVDWDFVWPLALIIPGIGLLFNAVRHPAS